MKKRERREFSFEKAAKFSDEDKFFDINYLWVPGLKQAVENLYYTTVRPEAIVLLSLVSGLIASWFYSKEGYLFSLFGVIFIQLKNFLDTVDGYLARAKGMESRLGRFLDSLADAAVYLCLFTAFAMNPGIRHDNPFPYLLVYLAMISAFLQCSVYNYYLISYKTSLKGEGINRTDERFRNEEIRNQKKTVYGLTVIGLQWLYQWIYAWQDRIVEYLDGIMLDIYRRRIGESSRDYIECSWYADKVFLALVSPLCFGTQILELTIFTLFGNPEGFLWFTIVAGNLYVISLFVWRSLLKG